MTTSAADITVPAQPAAGSVELPTITFFRGLRAMLDGCHLVNKNEKMILVIKACIDQGFNQSKRLAGVASTLGFERQHAMIILKSGVGTYWHRDEQGHYHHLD